MAIARYLVTGGAGFIGSHLVDALVGDGHVVRVLDNFSTGRRANLESALASRKIEIVEGDVREADVVREAVVGTDGVFHLAALVSVQKSIEQPQFSFDINVYGTVNVLEAARWARIPRVVLASSAAVYGDASVPIQEDVVTWPLSPYALDKLSAEQYCALYGRLYGLETLALRFFNVYGLRQDPTSPYSGVISIIADKLRRRVGVTVFGDGEQTRDFVHVSDVVQANIAAMTIAHKGFVACNVATGRAVSINQLLKTLSSQAGWQPPIEHAPVRAGDVRHSRADISRAYSLFGYAPRYHLDVGLRELTSSA